MKIRIMSDLHLEFNPFVIPLQHDDQESVLILAGDIGLVHKPSILNRLLVPFLTTACERFRHVIMILGNHEHYGGSLLVTARKLKVATSNLPNFTLLDNDIKILDNVGYIGATLWTDCGQSNPFAQLDWAQMNDSKVIRTGPNDKDAYKRPLLSIDTITEHKRSLAYIKESLRTLGQDKQMVVITHHAPSYLSQTMDDNFTKFYCSNLSNVILDYEPVLWIHGHLHGTNDYMIGNTRIISNARGYLGNEIVDFDPYLNVVL